MELPARPVGRLCNDADMSAITDYFSAPSDEAAAAALDDLLDLEPDDIAATEELYRISPDEATRPGYGPPRAKRRSAGEGIDPKVSLGQLERCSPDAAMTTSRPARGTDPWWRTARTVTRSYCPSPTNCALHLAASDPSALIAAAREWIFDEDAEPSEESVPFVVALAELASIAASRGERLYCRIIV